MKLSFALIALTSAADSQAPVISLNLLDITDTALAVHSDATPQGTHSAMTARHTSGTTTTVGDAMPANHGAPAQNSFADECVFKTGGAQSHCQEPVASAYDHHDGDITTAITTAYELFVESDVKKTPVKSESSATAIDTSQRGEWVITYDVSDTAGNTAEQVQFALIIVDDQAPVFDNTPAMTTATGCTGKENCLRATRSYITTAAGSGDVHVELCQDDAHADWTNFEWITTNGHDGSLHPTSQDNYDLTLTEANSVMMFSVTGESSYTGVYDSWTKISNEAAGQSVNVYVAKNYATTITSADFADIFGQSNQNNVITETGAVTVSDTIAPTILNNNDGSFECGYAADTLEQYYRTAVGAQYTDCYDDFLLTQGIAKNVVEIKFSTDTTPNWATADYIDDGRLYNGVTDFTPSAAFTAALGADTVGDGTHHANAAAQDASYNNHHTFLNGAAWSDAACADASITSCVRTTTASTAVKLQYSVVDHFGNADTKTATFTVVDTIAPTLYITTASTRTANADGSNSYATHTGAGYVAGEDCLHQDSTNGEHRANGASSNGGDWTQKHCVQTHDGVSTHATYDHTGTMVDSVDPAANVYASEVDIQHSAGYAADYKYVQELMEEGTGYACFDQCTKTSTQVEWVTSCAGDKDTTAQFNMLKPGTYYLKYRCYDAAKNEATACRTFQNVDKTRPVITILQAANTDVGTYNVQASRDNNYVDAGATCSDMVDGNISQDVEVSGDVVNMAAVGTYTINYNCEDSAGQTAIQATRTVIVEDTTCPTCELPGDAVGDAGSPETITVEASFPYAEEASTCTDTLDGAMPNAHIKGTVDVELTGTYVLTYSVTDKNGNGATPADCAGAHFSKTVVVEDTMVPIISLKYRGANLVGMMAESTTTTVNGWVIGAVASAVSGVALLGYAATRKATVATSVPV